MTDLITSLNITLPLIFMLAAGYGLRKLGWISKDFIRIANKLNYNVFLPCSVFAGTYCSGYDIASCADVLLIVVISLIAMFLISIAVSVISTTNKPRRGTMITGMYRSNYAYVGIPVVCAILGVTSNVLASITLAVCSMVSNVLTPIGFSINSGEKLSIKKLLKDVFANSYIIATIAAFILMLLKCPQFPTAIHKTITSLGSVCTPLAVVALGANLDFDAIKDKRRLLRVTNIFRLIVFPLIGTIVCILMGLRGEKLAVLYTLYACPAATLLFTVSQEMGGDTDLATEIVAVGTAFSMVTMTIGIYILKSIGMF